MSLIKLVNNEIVLGDEALLIKPIRDMFHKDKSKNKEMFYKQLSYIYFVYDPRSEYNWIGDIDERIAAVIKQEGLDSNFKVSKELKEAIELYTEYFNKSTALLLLKDTIVGFDKLRKFLKDIDLNETDDKGRPVHNISSIVSALKQIPQIALDLKKAQDLVEKEIDEDSKVRGGNDKISLLEDGRL